jgi:formamidopyrimidine-DNA glycosylase
MPELPDVEMTRRDLKRWLVGAIVTAADTEDPRLSRPASPRVFAHALVDRTFERVERRGKWLRLDLDDGGKASKTDSTELNCGGKSAFSMMAAPTPRRTSLPMTD